MAKAQFKQRQIASYREALITPSQEGSCSLLFRLCNRTSLPEEVVAGAPVRPLGSQQRQGTMESFHLTSQVPSL